MRKGERAVTMAASNDTRMICKSLDGLAKEVRWLRLLIEEVVKAECGRQNLEEISCNGEQEDPPTLKKEEI